jgi:phosphomannomutase
MRWGFLLRLIKEKIKEIVMLFLEKIKGTLAARTVAIALIVSFSLYNVGFALPEAEIAPPDIASETGPLSADDISVAIDSGSIRSKYDGNSGKLIVHIQDAHCNFEAQSNISKMLEQLSREAGINMISVEGAEGTVDTAWFRAFPDAEIRKEVATYFMKKGEITGAEYFSINSDYNGTIFGAETREHYVRNLKAFTEVYPHTDAIERYLKDLRSVGTRLKSLIYPSGLRTLDSKVDAFEDKELELSDFASYIDAACSVNGISKEKYGNFKRLVETLEYEDKIDFDVVDSERSGYIDMLSKKLSKEEMTDLVAESVRFKKGHIKAVDFYSFLRDLAREHDIAMLQEYPNLFYYYIYTKIYDGIDTEGLFSEINAIVRALKDKLMTDDTQRTLDRHSEMVDMLVKLVNIELTNEDYDLFNEYASEFTIEDVLVFYSSLAGKYNLNYSVGTLPEQISENLPKMVSFYEIAMKRDNSLISNTLRQMDAEGKDRCVLIAGGFHTRGIKSLLEEKGVSYVVVTPKITKDVETPYIKVLTNQRTSIEDIITDSAAMPGTAIRTSKEKITDNVKDLLSPLMRFAYGITMYLDPAQRQALRNLSEQMGETEGVGLEFEEAVAATFEEAVQLLTLEWVMKVKSDMINQLGMTPSLANAEFNKFIANDDLWDMLTAVYLSKYDDYFEATGSKPSEEVKTRIKAEFDKLRGQSRQTPGVQAAGPRVLEGYEPDRFDAVLRASFESGKWHEEKNIGMHIGREEFAYIVHDGLVDALANEGLPTNVHPGRGGAALQHKGLQAHIDAFVFNNLTPEELVVLARHEVAHLDIFNENQDSESYLKWVEAGRPTGQAQEDFVNTVLGHDVTRIAAKIEKISSEKLSEKRLLNLDPALKATSDNIDFARKAGEESQSTRIVGVVSGSEVDQKNWGVRLKKMSKRLFNRDGTTAIVSLQEKIGEKTREGNFLGTLLAYKKVKEIAAREGVEYRNFVTLLGMLFGRGERMSPFTQMKGDRKPSIQVTASYIEIDGVVVPMTAIEEAMMYFTPVAIYLERRGFKGILDKWGDETEIASVDLTTLPTDPRELAEHDVIKVISVIKITDELAEQKDWVVFDEDGNMLAQLSRNDKSELIRQLQELGIKPDKDGEYYGGVSLGPVAVSYDVLDIAEEVFADEIVTSGVYFDFDPYFLMALAMPSDPAAWQQARDKDPGLQKLEAMVPDFFAKVQRIKQEFLEKYNRPLNLKTLDLGADVFWADIGQHSAMREKYLAINDRGPKGIIARKLEGITGQRDENGNILVNSTVAPGANIRNSVIINSQIGPQARIDGAVVKDSTLNNIVMEKGTFAVSSYRTGKTVLRRESGIFESYGSSLDELTLVEHGRHGTLLTRQGPVDLKVHEKTNLRDKAITYDVPLVDEMHGINNPVSFDEAYNEMFGVSMEELERRRAETIAAIKMVDQRNVSRALKFGTSGLRDTVTNMTDQEVYINARGFVKYLIEKGELDRADSIYVAGDLRPSTPRLMSAVGKAIEDEGRAAGYDLTVKFDGFVASPAVSAHGFATGKASVMVTGSHIPADRNGIKFNKKSGEVLKSDEKGILSNVLKARKEVYAQRPENYIFDPAGAFKDAAQYQLRSGESTAVELFKKRYLDVFPRDALKGKKVFLYQHSAVGRDVVAEVFRALGADVIVPGVDEKGRVTSAEDNTIEVTYVDEDGTTKNEMIDLRSEVFVPVDTEKVVPRTKAILRKVMEMYRPDVIISTDGDSDRPLLADEKGNFLPGDKLGALVSIYLKPDFAAIPVSANDAVVTALRKSGIKVQQTQIGSPYVIAAMNEEMARFPDAKVVGWEVNGGFLTGSDFTISGKTLEALPTRDAILPLISAILLAKQEGKTISALVETRLPARYTDAGVVDDKTPGLENYKAEMGKEIINMFSPKDDVYSIVFYDEKGNLSGADYKPGVHRNYADLDQAERDKIKKEFAAIRSQIARYFNRSNGFGRIVSVNFIDGIRVVFDNNEVAHMRPSGNAPEFRMYATADTQQRATEIAESRKQVVPLIVADLLSSSGATDPELRLTPGVYTATSSFRPAQKEVLRVPLVNGQPILSTGQTEYMNTVVLTEGEDGEIQAYDEIDIFGARPVSAPEVLEGRTYDVEGEKGEVTLGVDGEAVTVPAGMAYKLAEASKDVTLSKASAERAVAVLKYANTPREQAAYRMLYMVKKHLTEIKKHKIKIHIPQELFYPGGKKDVGSLQWTGAVIQGLVGNNVELSPYNSSLGLQELGKRVILPGDGYIHILVASDKQLENRNELSNEKVKDFVAKARPLPIPQAALTLANGWDFSLETVGWGLILGAVTPEQIKDVQDITSPAADMHGFIRSILKKNVPREYLYMMLPYETLPGLMDQIESDEIRSVLETGNILEWMHLLVQNILFEMPIKAFDPRDALRQRMKVMWSV